MPTLEDGPQVLTQSLAIIEYLNELHPEPPLLPAPPADRAYVRSVALQVASEIHPVNNLRVLQYLKRRFGISEERKSEWYQHWIDVGFSSFESRLKSEPRVGDYVFGSIPTIADRCFVPKVWNARRFEIPLNRYPIICRACAVGTRLKMLAQGRLPKRRGRLRQTGSLLSFRLGSLRPYCSTTGTANASSPRRLSFAIQTGYSTAFARLLPSPAQFFGIASAA